MAPITTVAAEMRKQEEYDDIHEDPIEDEEDEGSDLDPSQMEYLEHHRRLDQFLSPLSLDEAVLYKLARRFSGVYRDLALHSEEQFLPTPVTHLPTGLETGRYLAIDVGGTNLRVAFIELLGDAANSDIGSTDASEKSTTIRRAQRQRVRRTLERAWPIQEHLKMDNAEDLFSWIGDRIAEVVAESLSSDATKGKVPEELEMGITFSFPIMQESLSEATLMPMGKGFAITSDLNLRKILLSGYERHTRRPDDEDEPSSKRRKLFALPKLKITAITNDAVATLASLAYAVKSLPNSRVAMGIIVGTGCNATIPMKLSSLHETKANHVKSKDSEAVETVINTEWTLAGSAPPLKELEIITKWDIELDRACARPGFQPFEYLTGGRYIGELIRLILFDYLTNVKGLSSKELPANLIQEYALTTTYISDNVARARSDQELADGLNHSLPSPESSEWHWDAVCAAAFRKIARTVQKRAAGLIAAAVVGLLACANEIELKVESTENSPQPSGAASPEHNGGADVSAVTNLLSPSTLKVPTNTQRGNRPIVPVLSPTPTPADWQSGPEELVVAYTGGIIQHYPNFKTMCQQFIDRLIMRTGPQKSGKSVFLREVSDGGVIGAGVLAGMVANR
ncbi:hexokinase family protein XprF [Aspergillus bombycis]|uniref:Phosphotransferase n=1 Tax=Aspergillus bombycis TaxID=109264 RepID=A0A1F7ZQC7_9EURO|nr:hexokinase family protein XprF [Aspergillus bombycis]OGM41642.1 hexokinase family protein XprF [Aspergillus bombycis]